MNKRTWIAILIGIVIGIGGYYLWQHNYQTSTPIETPEIDSAEDSETLEDNESSDVSENYDPNDDIKFSEQEKVSGNGKTERRKAPDNCANFNINTNTKRVSGFFDNDKIEDSVELDWIDHKTGELDVKASSRPNYKQFIYSRGPAKYVTLIPAAKGEVHLTSCGKGYWPCAKNEPPKVKLKHDGFIEYNCFYNSSYLYEWDTKSAQLKMTPLGDNKPTD